MKIFFISVSTYRDELSFVILDELVICLPAIESVDLHCLKLAGAVYVTDPVHVNLSVHDEFFSGFHGINVFNRFLLFDCLSILRRTGRVSIFLRKVSRGQDVSY